MTGSPDDYQQALLDLFPPGDAYPRDAGSIRGQIVGSIADGLARAEAVADGLALTEGDPRTATFMFPDWVTMTGVATQPTPAETLAQVMTRINGIGGQSPNYYIAIAAALGFAITITRHAPRRMRSSMGTAYGLGDWAFVWDVVAPMTTQAPEQLIQRLAPAHTLVRFIYF